MEPSNRRPVVVRLVASLSLSLIFGVILACEVPGKSGAGRGATSGAPSRESDSYLEDEAQTAQLAMQALDVFRRERGNFPADAAELASVVPEVGGGPELAGGWSYSPDGGGYRLSHRLSSGSRLVYTYSGSSGSWEYTPAGGSPRAMNF
jgi:hypothetical protein